MANPSMGRSRPAVGESLAQVTPARPAAVGGGWRGLGGSGHCRAGWRDGTPGSAKGFDPLDGDVASGRVLNEPTQGPAGRSDHRGTARGFRGRQRRTDALNHRNPGPGRCRHERPELQTLGRTRPVPGGSAVRMDTVKPLPSTRSWPNEDMATASTPSTADGAALPAAPDVTFVTLLVKRDTVLPFPVDCAGSNSQRTTGEYVCQ